MLLTIIRLYGNFEEKKINQTTNVQIDCLISFAKSVTLNRILFKVEEIINLILTSFISRISYYLFVNIAFKFSDKIQTYITKVVLYKI